LGHSLEVSDLGVALTVTLPVAAFVVVVWLLHAPLAEGYRDSAAPVLGAAVAVLAVALLVPVGLSIALVPWLAALPVALLVATHVDGSRDHQPG
jgi:uncharacterized membrane protein YoaK (UPF0700 family)